MRRSAFLLAALLLSLCLLCACGETKPGPIHEGETYIEGLWYLGEGELHVGYNFFSDGGGFLFIGETAVPIRYGISGESIYISDNGNMECLSFSSTDEGLWIDGMLFLPVEEDPEVSAAIESMRSEAQQSAASSNSAQTGKLLVQLVTLAAAAGVAVILVRYLRNRKRS